MVSDTATALGLPAADWCLTTERMRLTPLRPDDAADVVSMTDHPSITDVITFLPAPFTVADADALIDMQADGTDLFLGGRLGADILAVIVGLHFRGSVDLELGYWVHPHHHGQRLAQEAARAALSAASRLLPSRHLFAECRPDNRRSWRILESLGFVPGGTRAAARRPGRQRFDWSPGLHGGHNDRRSGRC